MSNRSFCINSIVILLSIFLLFFVNYFFEFYLDINEESIKELNKSFFIEKFHYGIWPEPIEQLQIFFTFILLPLLLFTFHFIFHYCYKNNKILNIAITFLSLFLITLLIYFDLKLFPTNFLYLDETTYRNDIRGMIHHKFLNYLFPFSVLITFYYLSKPIKFENHFNIYKNVYLFILFVIIFICFLFNISSDFNYNGLYDHLNAIYYSIVQINGNKYPSIDFQNQYGLYPYFFKPFLYIFSPSVFNVTFIFNILFLFSTFYFLKIIKIITNNNFLFFILSFAFIFYSFFMLPNLSGWQDSYFQYKPLRTFFQAIILFLIVKKIINNNFVFHNFNFILIIFLCGLSILWNFESGFVISLTLVLFISCYILFNRNFSTHQKIYQLCKFYFLFPLLILLIFFIFNSYIFYLSNRYIDYMDLFLNIRNWSGLGFWMMPMPLFNYWNLVALLYLSGLSLFFYDFFNKNINNDSYLLLLFSIFGLINSVYYLGRSHDFNLIHVSYPIFFIIALYIKNLHIISLSKKFKISFHLNFFRILFFFFIFTLCLNIINPKKIESYVKRYRLFFNEPVNNLINEDIKLISRNSKEGDSIVILRDYYDGILFNRTKTVSSLNLPGSSEMILKNDLLKLEDHIINGNDKLFISLDYLKSLSSYLYKNILDNFYPIDFGYDLIYFKKGSPKIALNDNLQINVSDYFFKNNNNNFLTQSGFPDSKKVFEFDMYFSNPIKLRSVTFYDVSSGAQWTSLPLEHLWSLGFKEENLSVLP